MFLKQTKSKNGRIFLSIVESYYDKEKKSTKAVTVKKIGYLDDFKDQYADPISHFKNLAKEMTLDKQQENEPVVLKLSKNEVLDNSNFDFNYGYLALSKIYHSLELDQLLKKLQRKHDFQFDSNAIMKLLIYTRAICPGSKKNAFENKELFFDRFDFSLDDIYRSLSFFNDYSDDIQMWLNKMVKEKYGRNTNLVYYDVTNYYFEIDESDDFRKKGVSKEHRPDPIVQMGLFMDENGLPISYKLFPGNTLDKMTLIPAIEKVQSQYRLGRTIVVGDRGMMMGDNIAEIKRAKNGYVLSYSIRSAKKEFQEYVLDQSDYSVPSKDGYKIKSRIYPREISVTLTNGQKIKKNIKEKQVIFYSPKYAAKARNDRASTIEKARKLVSNPSTYTRATSYGAAEYVKNITYNKKTGEIIPKEGKVLLFDEDKLKEKEALDGYYAIVTSELEESEEKIIEIYRGLWKIEESFKVMKSELEARPIYLSKQEHIEAHFLTCFITLLVGRIIENQLNRKYPLKKILDSLSKSRCSHIQENVYLFRHNDEVLEDISGITGIEFNKKIRKLSEIKKVLSETKK